jgi:DNA-directed RNA polymerase II subunit RPB1
LDSGPLRKASFEETVEILLEASLHSERDNLVGVTENIMLGQLAPIGTGSFDVVMDAKMLAKFGKEDAAWDENEIVGTPVMAEEMNYGYMTPCVGETPHGNRGGRTSEYGGTPGMSVHDASFSPGFNNAMSPAYGSPHGYVHSPGYGSPTSPTYRGIKVQSPIYNNFVSPIYQAGSGMGSSPTITQSPTYNVARGI